MVGIWGVDNALARIALEEVGFKRVIEAGLGKSGHEYLSFQIHTFPGPQKARDRWGRSMATKTTVSQKRKPAYEALAENGMDTCGITTLEGQSVGACFVGTTVSTLMVAELLRIVHGSQAYGIIDGTRSLEHRKVIRNLEWTMPFNPGTMDAIGKC